MNINRAIYQNIIFASEAKYKKAPSTCMYGNSRQRIKSFKMVADASDKNQYSYFYALNLFPNPTRPDRDAVSRLICRKLYKMGK